MKYLKTKNFFLNLTNTIISLKYLRAGQSGKLARRTLTTGTVALCTTNKMKTFETLQFDNLALRTLPIDSITENYVREVKNACFSRVDPTPLKNPKMVVFSKQAMALLDLDDEQLKRPEAVDYLSGNKKMPGSETAAHCYCGHQFGVFAGQLGDGAAIYLGEVINGKNERWEIQLKGAGLTPYSRSADGRKVLRSTLREFMCSEAMHFLDVKTTRAGSCIISDSTVIRDIFYDGNPKLERCAVVLRIAPTFIRFGSFEIFRPLDRSTGGRGPSYGRNDILIQLLDYVCDSFFKDTLKELENDANLNTNDDLKQIKYEKVFTEIVKKTARLVADWQCVGFVHGVLNTDNMSIMGLTIDYGPFGFLDRFDPDHIFNGSDNGGRYTYRNQPDICEWNCLKLAEALSPVFPLEKSTNIVKSIFKKHFNEYYMNRMSRKFGLSTIKETDEELFKEFLNVLYETGADFTNSFRKLSQLNLSGPENIDKDINDYLSIILDECNSIDELKAFVRPKFPKDTLEKLIKATESEPDILSYFGLSESFIKNQTKLLEKHEKIKNYTAEDKKKIDSELWSKWLRNYIERVYEEPNYKPSEDYKRERTSLMNSNNPRFILRNHLAQNAIEAAEGREDFDEAKMLLKVLENPFSDEPLNKILSEFDANNVEKKMQTKYYEKGPTLLTCVRLTCSS